MASAKTLPELEIHNGLAACIAMTPRAPAWVGGWLTLDVDIRHLQASIGDCGCPSMSVGYSVYDHGKRLAHRSFAPQGDGSYRLVLGRRKALQGFAQLALAVGCGL